MIAAALGDGKRAVKLFRQENARQRMRKGHIRKGQEEIRAPFHRVGEAVRAADDERQLARAARTASVSQAESPSLDSFSPPLRAPPPAP